jgi:hypothetical protein
MPYLKFKTKCQQCGERFEFISSRGNKRQFCDCCVRHRQLEYQKKYRGTK